MMKSNKRAEKIMIQVVKETVSIFTIKIFRTQKKERLFKLLVDIII
jgi:hypothetical protein